MNLIHKNYYENKNFSCVNTNYVLYYKMLFKKRRQEKEYPHIRDIEKSFNLQMFLWRRYKS